MGWRDRSIAAVVLVAACFACAPAQAEVLPFWTKIEKAFDTNTETGAIATAPGGDFWILERATGKVRVMVAGKEKASLTISVTSTCAAGLLGVAFDPDYAANGRALIYYVDSGNRSRVDEIFFRRPSSLSLGVRLVDIGAVVDDCRPGGGIAVGKDGKLYVATGDLGTSGSAQDSASLKGKVLRVNLDGSTPSDNPTPGSLVWAKGFRQGRALTSNPNTPRAGGTFYMTDAGAASPAAADEVNAVKPGANYGWDVASGANPSYEQPIATYASSALVAPGGTAVLTPGAFPLGHDNALLFAAQDDGDSSKKGRIRELKLTGTDLDLLAANGNVPFYDPRGDSDGTQDAGCPNEIAALSMGRDGAVYAGTGAGAANPGIWRIYTDKAGPREVSTAGSPFPLTVEKDTGTQLKLGWEDLGSLDAGRAKRYAAGQRAETYEIFEGTLSAGGFSYTHAPFLSTNGNPDGTGRRKLSVSPGSGSRYYLVSAQGDNLEGSLGKSSAGIERPLPATMTADYCNTIGWGRNNNTCARDFQNETTGFKVKLKDYNPKSPTYGQRLSLADFRGKVMKLALTSNNCFWCQVEAQQEDVVDKGYRGRDFVFISVFTVDYGIWHVYNETTCASTISSWANTYNTNTPILCDEDLNGDGFGDVSNWFDQCNCAPQNFYIDQGGVIYNYVQGAQTSSNVITAITPEVNAETCE